MGYKYFDTPDGKDCDKKILYLVRKAGVAGLFLSSGYVVLVDTPPTYTQILARYARITFPCIAAAAIGSMSVCLLTDYRKKDDQFNHLYGGFLGGLAGGLAKGHLGHGIVAGIFLAGLAFTIKYEKMENFDINKTDFKLNTEDFWSKNYDFRWTTPRPPGWVAK